MAATATQRRTARSFRHLDGCPVAQPPDDPEAAERLAARVEHYREYIRPLDTRDGKPDVLSGRVAVTHCTECGALAYEKE